jgi:hypothetical protein
MSVIDELTKLQQLLEKGALTKSEFECQKARLLNEPPEAAAHDVAAPAKRRTKGLWWKLSLALIGAAGLYQGISTINASKESLSIDEPPACNTDAATQTLRNAFDQSQFALLQKVSLVEIDKPSEVSSDPQRGQRSCSVDGTLNNLEKVHITYEMEIRPDGKFFLKLESKPAQTTHQSNSQNAASSPALNPDVANRPSIELAALVGKHPGQALDDPELKAKLQLLLKDKFLMLAERVNVATEIERKGDYIIGDGCMAHMCSEMASYAVNVLTGETYALIVSDDILTLFAPDPNHLPPPIKQWLLERGGKG